MWWRPVASCEPFQSNRSSCSAESGCSAGRAQVLEEALLGPQGDDRPRTSLDEDVGALSGAPAFFDGHQTENPVRAPILAVPQEYHAAPLHIHTVIPFSFSS